MSIRKIDLMHREFGKLDGKRCKDCTNFVRERYHDYSYSKCTIYGRSNSAATDWNGRYEACGAFGKEMDGIEMVRAVRPKKGDFSPLEGQFDLLEEEGNWTTV